MPKFVTKPPIVEAAYWDGTMEGFEQIRDLLRNSEYSRRVSFNVRTRGDVESGFTGMVADLDGLPWLGGRDANTQMYEDCWLVCDATGRFEILGDEKFQRLYAPVEES